MIELQHADLDKIDFNETNEVLKSLKNLNLQTAGDDEIKSHLLKLSKHIGVKKTLDKQVFIQRGVLLDNEAEDFFPKQISRLSYNSNCNSIGRCNIFGQPVFYGCISTEVMEAYNCTAMEILPLNKNGIFKHRFVISNWLLNQPTEFLLIGGSEKLYHLNKASAYRNDFFNEKLNQYKEVIFSLMSIDKFLCNEFNKEVKQGEDYNYRISANYCSILKDKNEPGIIYPSVKSSGAGLNIAIFSEKIDDKLVYFDKAIYGIFYNRNGEFCNEYTLRATSENNIDLNWKEAYFRLHKKIKEYYIGENDFNPLKNNISVKDLGKPINRS